MMLFNNPSQVEVDIALAETRAAVSRLTEETKAALLALSIEEGGSLHLRVKDFLAQYDQWTNDRAEGGSWSLYIRSNLVERATAFNLRAQDLSRELARATGKQSAVAAPSKAPAGASWTRSPALYIGGAGALGVVILGAFIWGKYA